MEVGFRARFPSTMVELYYYDYPQPFHSLAPLKPADDSMNYVSVLVKLGGLFVSVSWVGGFFWVECLRLGRRALVVLWADCDDFLCVVCSGLGIPAKLILRLRRRRRRERRRTTRRGRKR